MSVMNRSSVFAIVFMLFGGAVVHAQPRSLSDDSQSRSQLLIYSATDDRAAQTLTVTGQHFGRGPQLFCEWRSMQVVS